MKIACCIIAGPHRPQLIKEIVLPSVLSQGFDDVIVVGDFPGAGPFRTLIVPPLTHSTIDALVKRDVATLATDADILIYLSDDHLLGDGFGTHLRDLQQKDWDVLVPSRFVVYNGQKLPLNNGALADNPTVGTGYCGGHGGVFRRRLIERMPWSTMPHHRNWDLLGSLAQQRLDAKFVWTSDLEIVDVEPGATPWL
jgi:hypothetical protein